MKSSKKTFFKNCNTVIGGGLLLCIALFYLTSCDNFLNGADTRQEILDAIAYNNAPSSTLILKAPEGTGDFLSGGEKPCKVGYSIDVQFTVNSESYVYRGLEAVSKSNAEVSRSDYVEFSELSTESEKNKGVFKVRIKLLSQSDDIMIRPKCILVPKLMQASPVFTPSGYEQDEIIKFTFNKSISPESFGTFDCISIYSENGDLKQFFDVPYFSNNNTVLNIPPKQETHILTPDSGQKLDITVNLDFSAIKDSDGLSISQNYTHSYRINDSFGNQQKAKFLVRTVEGKGSFISDGEKECTVGYGFELQFSLNQSDYKFVGLEAVSKAGNESRDDFVSFTNLEGDASTGSYKIYVRALKSGDDILIRPKCILIPKVLNIEPAFTPSGYDQDEIIKLTFNKTLDTASFGNFECISIYSESGDLKRFFATPYFSNDKTVLYISPKADTHILTPDSGQKLDISVSIDFAAVKDADGLSITQNAAHTYRINDSFGNQQKTKILVRTVEGTGSFISDGEKECTVGYGFELQFSVNQADYKFVGLEAVSKAGNESRDDFVSFTSLEGDASSGTYKIFVRALKPSDDILIQPKCILIPKVTGSEPASDNTSYKQDTSIKVSFNKKIRVSDFKDENGYLKNITITTGDTNLLDTANGKLPYYKSPYLENDDKTLVIPIVKGHYIISDTSTKEINLQA